MSNLLKKASTSTQTRSSSRKVKVTRTIQKTLPDGKVVTETMTEYKEFNDDNNGFSSLGFNDNFATRHLKLRGFENPPLRTRGGDSTSSDNDEGDVSKFEQETLESHNKYRSAHGTPPLKLDSKLCKYAKEWAEKLAKEDGFQHRRNGPYGENLYCSWSSNPNATCPGDQAVENWYAEKKNYRFGVEPMSMNSGHFTQVIWKDTKRMGVGKAKSPKSGKIVVVANYDPPGNFVGSYVQNVPSPKK